MIYPRQSSSFSSYILISIGIHIILLSIFNIIFRIETKPKHRIMIEIGRGHHVAQQGSQISENIEKQASTAHKSKNSETKKKSQVNHSKNTATQAKEKISPSSRMQTSKMQDKNTQSESISKSKELASELDKLLNKNHVKKSADFLENASWSGHPRKTLHFPNLSENIPIEYKQRGYGFSTTVKITFNPKGWVSSIELLNSSGDPRIDNIFRTELRKIQIEETSANTYDTIIKTFTISVK